MNRIKDGTPKSLQMHIKAIAGNLTMRDQFFGNACADVWVKVEDRCDAKATSIGALINSMHESVIDEFNGAEIRLKRM